MTIPQVAGASPLEAYRAAVEAARRSRRPPEAERPEAAAQETAAREADARRVAASEDERSRAYLRGVEGQSADRRAADEAYRAEAEAAARDESVRRQQEQAASSLEVLA